MTTDTEKPQTIAETINEIRKEDKETRVFVLYEAGVGSRIVAAARSYPEMWKNAERDLNESKKELIKRSYVFDVMTARDAARLVA